MKKEIFNILFLCSVVLAVIWLYWPENENTDTAGVRKADSFVLAISWQPAFCESKPNKPECRSQRENRFDAQNFSLHGLWPQPRNNVYCGVPSRFIKTDKRGRWDELPKLELSEKLRDDLSSKMPGYRSNLHRHEWFKHGTCMGGGATPQTYYDLSLSILNQINQSELQSLIANNIGKEISASQIKKAVEKSFGKSAGERVSVSCKRDGKRTLITELKVSVVLKELSNNNWIIEAPKIKTGCRGGIIDPVGLQ